MKILLSTILVLFLVQFSLAQDADKNWFQIYGFAMTDIGYNANQIHPDWYDVVRPTKLPTMKNEYGTDGNVFFSVRQTRFGVKSSTQTAMGELFTQFEFEMFGTGVDAGQTTIRLRHAYGELRSVWCWSILGHLLWILMYFQIQLSTGDQTEWYFSEIFKFDGCR